MHLNEKGFSQVSLEGIRGIILCGGGDVAPELYNEKDRYARYVSVKRDKFELGLVDFALKNNIPILGLCRGAQVINVFFGGTLIQDLIEEKEILGHCSLRGEEQKDIVEREREHDIEIYENSLLYSILRVKRLRVNSLHHQAIGDLGRGLVASARSGDSVIEAVEIPRHRHPFFLGVEWHPERMIQDGYSKRLIKAFVKASEIGG